MTINAHPAIVYSAAATLAALAGAVWWKIFKKAGFRGALGLLMLVPVVNIVLLLIFALRRWPIETELERLHSRAQQD